jgi:GMP synthase (glutamine-hydrolysing)
VRRKLVLIRHGEGPIDDRVVNWACLNCIDIKIYKLFKGELIEDIDDSVIGTVLYGGQYNVFETQDFPFLEDEYQWIRDCLTADIPMLGICQGAQQIAYHLGAKVGPLDSKASEFGYYQIEPTPEAVACGFLKKPLFVTQAHSHTFGIPAGAIRLAGSKLFPNQAFKYGEKVYGFQFHPEVTIEGFRRWQKEDWSRQLGEQSPKNQTRLMYKSDASQAKWFYKFLDNLFQEK